jgi:hypothetical protein
LKDFNLPKISILDVILGKQNAYLYPSTFAQKGWGYTPSSSLKLYKDPTLKFDFFKMLVAKQIEGSDMWYGEGKYCDFDFVNDWE